MKTLLTTLFLLLSVLIFSQTNETIYLKNGSIVSGQILEMKPNEYVKFKTEDGNIWVFSFKDISKFDLRDSKVDSGYFNEPKSYVLCDLGFLAGTVENEVKAPLSFMARMNFKIFNGIYLGAGAGLEFFQMTYIPVFGELRIKPGKSRVSFFTQAGPTFPFDKKGKLNQVDYTFKPGYFINPGMSYTFNYRSDAAFTLSIGYRYQETDAQRINSDGSNYMPYTDYSLITRFNRFSIRLGYCFR